MIELLIVVAIIGILAAIAIPNFLQAQTRAKVAKAQSDMRTISLGIEAFVLDHNYYPLACNSGIVNPPAVPPVGIASGCGTVVSDRYIQLTTPIDYISNNYADEDPFMPLNVLSGYDSYDYFSVSTWKYCFNGTHPNSNSSSGAYSGWLRGSEYRMVSSGPDRIQTYGNSAAGVDYDPTNGTVSTGDILRLGPRASDPGSCMYPYGGVTACW